MDSLAGHTKSDPPHADACDGHRLRCVSFCFYACPSASKLKWSVLLDWSVPPAELSVEFVPDSLVLMLSSVSCSPTSSRCRFRRAVRVRFGASGIVGVGDDLRGVVADHQTTSPKASVPESVWTELVSVSVSLERLRIDGNLGRGRPRRGTVYPPRSRSGSTLAARARRYFGVQGRDQLAGQSQVRRRSPPLDPAGLIRALVARARRAVVQPSEERGA